MSTRIGVLSATVMAAALSLSAQSAPQKPQDPQRPIFRSEANFVRVDVFPTRNGSPVKHLTAADFELPEARVPQKVGTFEFVEVLADLAQPARQALHPVHGSLETIGNARTRAYGLVVLIQQLMLDRTLNVRAPL